MIQDLTSDEKQLAGFMSELSEKCYSAGWMENLEYVLWDAVINGPRDFGNDTITSDEIEVLASISNRTNSWILFDNDKEEISIPLEQWRKQFSEDIRQAPDKLYKK